MIRYLIRDLRVARRSLRRTPVVTIAAVLSIAVGIAATTSVFGVVDAALFRPLPFEQPNRLVMLYWTHRAPGEAPVPERWSWARAGLLRERAQSFDGVATFSSAVLALTSDDADPMPVDAEVISTSYWSVLRVRPMIGRVPGDSDEQPEIVLSQRLWRDRFGADHSVIGRVIGLNGVPFRVVGIANAGFDGLSGHAQAWIPARTAPLVSYPAYLTSNQNFISVVARLGDGVSRERAAAELAVIGRQLERESPPVGSPQTTYGTSIIPVSDARIDPSTRRPMLFLLAASICLLLLACANVAGLLFGRAVARRREIAVRVALGASQTQIMIQLLVESLVITAMGTAIGIVVAIPVATGLMMPTAAARGRNFYGALGEFAAPHLDVRVLAFCIATCAIATLALAWLPAMRAAKVDVVSDLKEGQPSSMAHSSWMSPRQAIVGFQTALAVVLLFSAGLFAASWRRISTTAIGFDPTNVLTFMVRPSETSYPAPRAPAIIERVLASIHTVPGVEAASVDGCFPVGTGCANSTLLFVGRANPRADQAPPVLRHYVGPEHFRVLRVPVLRGRVFNDADQAGSKRVAVINELAAKRFWPNEDPIGKRVYFGGGSNVDRPDSSAEIVGIVGNVAYQRIDEHPFQPDFYTPYAQFTYATRMVIVRTRSNPDAVAADIRRAIRRADPTLAPFDVESMNARLSDSWSRLAHEARLVGTFAIAAVLLAAMGIFAVITQTIVDRRRELAIRLALGASSRDVLAASARTGVFPAALGLVTGTGIALAVGRVLSASLYAVPTLDPTVLCLVVAGSTTVVLVATGLAARRALATQPVEALKSV